MKLAEPRPETIKLHFPGYDPIYITMGTARDLMTELQAIFTKRVQDGKGLL